VVILSTGNYLLSNEKKNYVDAQKACEQRGMDLVSLETLAEKDVINNYLGSLGTHLAKVFWCQKKNIADRISMKSKVIYI
jgi:hypothetical protein